MHDVQVEGSQWQLMLGTRQQACCMIASSRAQTAAAVGLGEEVCYVMYTSGSTGTPVGVCGTAQGQLHAPSASVCILHTVALHLNTNG